HSSVVKSKQHALSIGLSSMKIAATSIKETSTNGGQQSLTHEDLENLEIIEDFAMNDIGTKSKLSNQCNHPTTYMPAEGCEERKYFLVVLNLFDWRM
ncbi:hypothetical protein Tco_0889186, partial [Tanacetum coccineum]